VGKKPGGKPGPGLPKGDQGHVSSPQGGTEERIHPSLVSLGVGKKEQGHTTEKNKKGKEVRFVTMLHCNQKG